MTPQDKQDELQMMIAREAVSLAALAVLMLLLNPRIQLWVSEQKQRFRKRSDARKVREDNAVAELQQQLSRDLPLVERGLVDP